MNLSKRVGVPARPRHPYALCAVAVSALALAVSLPSYGSSSVELARAVLVGTGTSGSPSGASPTVEAGGARPETGTFRIAGSATKLFPGHTVPLVLTVTNPQSFAIVVTSLTVGVHNASIKCAATNLSASAFASRLSVAAHRSSKATLHLSMHLNAPNACESAKFPLSFRGLAREA